MTGLIPVLLHVVCLNKHQTHLHIKLSLSSHWSSVIFAMYYLLFHTHRKEIKWQKELQFLVWDWVGVGLNTNTHAVGVSIASFQAFWTVGTLAVWDELTSTQMVQGLNSWQEVKMCSAHLYWKKRKKVKCKLKVEVTIQVAVYIHICPDS